MPFFARSAFNRASGAAGRAGLLEAAMNFDSVVGFG
jgi:hypothetical protein